MKGGEGNKDIMKEGRGGIINARPHVTNQPLLSDLATTIAPVVVTVMKLDIPGGVVSMRYNVQPCLRTGNKKERLHPKGGGIK